MNWNRTREILPREDVIVMTKIDDENGCRNEQTLLIHKNMWWLPDMSMYIYYNPTHWAYII